ncbi:methyltransferase domain-containing protein [Candidatus Pacearchaeota archaeon]|nr:methyltransferase domain-containing protein [Candidatus Pacearchaeota archaeon]
MKYQKLLDIISPLTEEKQRVEKTRDSLVRAIKSEFVDYPGSVEIKVIGSAATGNFLRWYRDIDCLMVFEKFDRYDFRNRFLNMDGFSLDEFLESPKFVRDKANGTYHHFSVSAGVTTSDRKREEHLDADMLYHPDFTLEHLTEDKHSDVLLTKQFLKNKGLYGAKIGGFAVEQIVSHYGGFSQFLDELLDGREIFIDYSGRYSGPKQPMVISYPYCGKDNLVSTVNEEDLEIMKKYALEIREDEDIFIGDSRRVLNSEFWKKRARKYGLDEEFGMPDIYLNHRENRFLRARLHPKREERILDAGCANGHTTIYVVQSNSAKVWGIDANEEAIKLARELAILRNRQDIHFITADLLNLDFADNFFDKVYSKRAISNLPSRKDQINAVKEIARVTRNSGRLFIFDLFTEGYDRLNKMRCEEGLEQISVPYHCLALDEKFIENVQSETLFRVIHSEDPTTTYYILTRVKFPKILGRIGKQPISNSLLNKIASVLPNIGSLGINKLYIFEKNDI